MPDKASIQTSVGITVELTGERVMFAGLFSEIHMGHSGGVVIDSKVFLK
ncbi:MAG: hypothetical protein VB078_03110 [Clostridiaceae bacterium]|nr:hypothetical protein [Clostridiaceae bacterium]